MEIFLDALLDALIDGVKMLPFLYLAYLLIEWLERHHGENIESALIIYFLWDLRCRSIVCANYSFIQSCAAALRPGAPLYRGYGRGTALPCGQKMASHR